MQINLRVVYKDGTDKELTGQAIDIVAFEERFDISMIELQKKMQMRHLLFIAWNVEKRTGGTKDTWEKWLESVETLDVPEPKK